MTMMLSWHAPAGAGSAYDLAVDDGGYGLDATFHGATGYQRAEHHEAISSVAESPTTFVGS
jgi:hypothetical protein